jgi:hypothetical protein
MIGRRVWMFLKDWLMGCSQAAAVGSSVLLRGLCFLACKPLAPDKA